MGSSRWVLKLHLHLSISTALKRPRRPKQYFLQNVLNNDLQLIARCGKACDKKAYSDLNYVGHKTIHIDLPFARSRELKHVKILGTEI